MRERRAVTKIRPSSRSDWHQVRVIGAYLGIAAVFVALIFFLKYRHAQDLEQSWNSSTATIEDVRSKPIEQVESARGGAMLYEVAVFVKYNSDGSDHERWITVDQRPVALAEAELQAFRWKGKQCVVRWRPSKPDQAIVEVS